MNEALPRALEWGLNGCRSSFTRVPRRKAPHMKGVGYAPVTPFF